jgi:hypothetical protein
MSKSYIIIVAINIVILALMLLLCGCATPQYIPTKQITRGCTLPPKCPEFKLIRAGTEWQDLYDNALIGKTCQINLNTYIDCEEAIK